MLTDKGEIAGSTNFTSKGFQENWETSAYVHFDPSDKDSIELREASKKQFLELWEHDTYDLSAKDLSAFDNRFAPAEGKDWIIDQERDYGTKKIIEGIEKYEEETGLLVEGFLKDPQYKARYDALLEKGYSEGDAAFLAAEEHFGSKEFRAMREQLASNQQLLDTERRVNDWKSKHGGSSSGE
jgi:hypothetical protein